MRKNEVRHVEELATDSTDGPVPAGGPDWDHDPCDGERMPRFGVCTGCFDYVTDACTCGTVDDIDGLFYPSVECDL